MAASDLRSWAVKGAEQRLGEIAEEARLIFRTFPELRQRGRGVDLPKASAGGQPQSAPRTRRRSKMSAAARKALSERMKKYWAARRGRGHKSTEQTSGKPQSRQGGPRKMSAAARKKISDAQKARWAEQRADSSSTAASAAKSSRRKK